MGFEYSRMAVGGPRIGYGVNTSVADTPNIDVALVMGTSGDAFFIKFNSPVAQTAATVTVYVFVTAITGSPTFALQAYAQHATTTNLPDTVTNLASSPSTASPTAANTWVSMTATVTLAVGATYYFIVENTHGTPASNHAAFRYGGPVLDLGGAAPGGARYAFACGYDDDGFADSHDAISSSKTGTAVIKFGDGTIIGHPYVATESHASNSNARGTRFQFAEDVVVSGIVWGGSLASQLADAAIYPAGSGTPVASITGVDRGVYFSSGVYRFAPVTLTGGTAYDVVMKPTSATTAGTTATMGMAEGDVPADVKACRLPGCAWVDGTPGSLSVDTSKIQQVQLIIDEWPAISGSGGTRAYGAVS